MDHLSATLAVAAGFDDWTAAAAYAAQRGITAQPSTEALHRLQRLAASERKNPNMVHPSVPTTHRAKYYQLLYDWAPIIAVSLEDLKTPANVPAMSIRTFG